MKNIFLTSSGLANNATSTAFLNTLKKPTSKIHITIIAHAKDDVEKLYLSKSRKELELLGFSQFNVINMFESLNFKSPETTDVIYLCGGNTFLILKQLRRTKLDQFILKSVEGGAIYIGVSAGGIIAGPRIEIAGWGSQGDANDTALDDLQGLNLVDFVIYPHFTTELSEEVKSFRKSVSYRVIEIKDEEAIVVHGNTITKI